LMRAGQGCLFFSPRPISVFRVPGKTSGEGRRRPPPPPPPFFGRPARHLATPAMVAGPALWPAGCGAGGRGLPSAAPREERRLVVRGPATLPTRWRSAAARKTRRPRPLPKRARPSPTHHPHRKKKTRCPRHDGRAGGGRAPPLPFFRVKKGGARAKANGPLWAREERRESEARRSSLALLLSHPRDGPLPLSTKNRGPAHAVRASVQPNTHAR
jgi:hypothetical protein